MIGIAPDALIRDRYRLVERIAFGGTGEVWRATDLVLRRQVAVKILNPERVADETFRQRFRAEARHAARLSHPGVAEVHDYGEQDDLAFLVMEYLPGQSLATILENKLSVEATLEVVAQVARALQAAHDLGLIHRDIKPSNLIVGRDGDVKVTDFGTSRALDASTVTEPGVVVGTAQYLAPEQVEGKPPAPATDIYALGVVAYTCLTGEPPFNGASPVEIATAHVYDELPPLPRGVPSAVRRLIEECTAKDAAQRPGSAAEVARRCADSNASLPRSAAAAGPTPRRRHPTPLSAAAAGAALAVGGMVMLGPGDGLFSLAPVGEDERVQEGSDHARPEPVPGYGDASHEATATNTPDVLAPTADTVHPHRAQRPPHKLRMPAKQRKHAAEKRAAQQTEAPDSAESHGELTRPTASGSPSPTTSAPSPSTSSPSTTSPSSTTPSPWGGASTRHTTPPSPSPSATSTSPRSGTPSTSPSPTTTSESSGLLPVVPWDSLMPGETPSETQTETESETESGSQTETEPESSLSQSPQAERSP